MSCKVLRDWPFRRSLTIRHSLDQVRLFGCGYREGRRCRCCGACNCILGLGEFCVLGSMVLKCCTISGACFSKVLEFFDSWDESVVRPRWSVSVVWIPSWLFSLSQVVEFFLPDVMVGCPVSGHGPRRLSFFVLDFIRLFHRARFLGPRVSFDAV